MASDLLILKCRSMIVAAGGLRTSSPLYRFLRDAIIHLVEE